MEKTGNLPTSKVDSHDAQDRQNVPTFDFAILEPVVRNRATVLLEVKLGALVPEMFNYFYHSDHPYDSICFCSRDWRQYHNPSYYGTYLTREEVHHALYS